MLKKKLSALTFYSSTATLCEKSGAYGQLNNRSISSTTMHSIYDVYKTIHNIECPDYKLEIMDPFYYFPLMADMSVIDELYAEFEHEVDVQPFEIDEARYRNRELIVRKLFESEADYLLQLQVALEYFKRPLLNHVRRSSGRHFLSKPDVGLEDIETLFGNLEDLVEISGRFVKNLTRRFRVWGPTQLISDIAHNTFQEMMRPLMEYIENYSLAAGILERLGRSTHTKRYVQASVEGLGLTHLCRLLDLPLYALPRYTAILSNLIHSTDPNHPDARNLDRCLSFAKYLELSFQKRTKACHNIGQLADLSRSIRNCPFLLKVPERSFIMRGFLTSVGTGGYGAGQDERRTFILLSDMLLYCSVCDTGLLFKGKIDLRWARVCKAPNRPDCFQVFIIKDSPKRLSGDMSAFFSSCASQAHLLRADSRNEQAVWVSEIAAAIFQLQGRSFG
ncbi:Dbl homology domain-containing protein [Phycomyces nitens]|nr:Dbl homology domain-containing protein [Phycomyces nitens]